MTDNVNVNPGTGATAIVGALDIGGGVEVQRVMPMLRTGASAVDVGPTTPLPVYQTGGFAGLATAMLVGGTPVLVAASNPARLSVLIQPLGAASLVLGVTATMNATVAAFAQLPADPCSFTESDYRGDVYALSPGGTQVVLVRDSQRP